jgi:hypothetical protein
MKNGGTEFENILETQHEAYLAQGRAKLEKISQPIKVFGPRGHQKIVHLDNPFLDFSGSWIERGGRNLHIEAKVTGEPRLPIYSEIGLKVKQMNALHAWHKAGAAVGVLWFHEGTARLLTITQIEAARAEGRGSVRWERAYPLRQTTPLVFWDYLLALGALYS